MKFAASQAGLIQTLKQPLASIRPTNSTYAPFSLSAVLSLPFARHNKAM